MKKFYFIVGILLVGVGLLVSLGTILATIDNLSQFTPLANLNVWVLGGLLPFAMGLFLWRKSGEVKWGKPLFFFLGFIISWGIWSTVSFISLRPRDYTQSWSQSERALAPDWLKNAIGRKLGSVMIFTPPTKSPACVLLQPQKPRQFPQIIIQDEDSDGQSDSFLIVDKLYRSLLVTIKDTDGIFDSVLYSTGIDTNSIFISDDNMDGVPDIRFGPGKTVAVTIDGAWHDLVHTNKKQYVEIDGRLSQVKAVDGTWRVIEEE